MRKQWVLDIALDSIGLIDEQILILYFKKILKERDFNILAFYYGINTDKKSISQISEDIGLSKQRVKEIISKVPRKIRWLVHEKALE